MWKNIEAKLEQGGDQLLGVLTWSLSIMMLVFVSYSLVL